MSTSYITFAWILKLQASFDCHISSALHTYLLILATNLTNVHPSWTYLRPVNYLAIIIKNIQNLAWEWHVRPCT